MTGERRRFSVTVTVPDWGQDHLSSDAIVAYVDDELADGPHSRAARHLAGCPECVSQVVAQGQARSALRSADVPSLPSTLLRSLRSIPQNTDLPGPPAGLAMTADGGLVSVLRPERPAVRPHIDGPPAAGPQTAGFRVAGPRADRSAAAVAPPPGHGRRSAVPRRMSLGAGAAVSGLALGALALGASGFASGPPALPTVVDRGVFDGSVLGGVPGILDARLRIAPANVPDPLTDQLGGVSGLFLGPR